MTPENAPSPSGQSPFIKLFATGLAAMLVGWLVLFGLSFPIAKPESIAVAVMWAISRWWIAFLVGAVALVLRALVSGLKPGTALVAYLAPAAFVAVLCGLCLLIYPDQSFRSEIFELMPLTLVFYLLGLIWVAFAKPEGGSASLLRAVIPPAIGGGIVAGMVAIPVFNSNPFIYRNAFDLKVSKVDFPAGKMTAEGVLEIRKAGDFSVFAPRFSYLYTTDGAEFDSMVEYGKITWGAAGPPKAGQTGTHPFVVSWEKNTPKSLAELQAGMSEENSIYLEIHKPGNEPNEVIYNLAEPIPGAMPIAQ